jgi:hypothetical protein
MGIKSIALAASTLALSTSVNAALITFEELGTKSGGFIFEPPLDNQYSAQGVTFDGGWEILNDSGGFGVDAISGAHFAAFNTDLTSNTIGMTFEVDISDISGSLGGDSNSTWTISVYLDGLLTSQENIFNFANEYIGFSLSSITGDYVTISSTGTIGVLEDLNFVSTVPVPAAVWLFGSGLLGLIAVARSKA